MSSLSLLKKAREILAHVQKNCAPSLNSPVQLVPTGHAPQADMPLDSLEIMPAAPNARLVYWETGTGQILGPAVPEYLAQSGHTYWIVTTFEGQPRWINADRLRSRKAFEEQTPVIEVEIVRETHR